MQIWGGLGPCKLGKSGRAESLLRLPEQNHKKIIIK